MAVVEERLRAALCEAGELYIDGLLKASLVGLESEGAGKQIGVSLQRAGVSGWSAADVGEVLLDAGLLEAGFGEVLRGTDEDAGTAADGGLEGGEVAAGLRREKEDANQSGGEGLVLPRRKMETSSYLTVWFGRGSG
jgi:hypothetical protein